MKSDRFQFHTEWYYWIIIISKTKCALVTKVSALRLSDITVLMFDQMLWYHTFIAQIVFTSSSIARWTCWAWCTVSIWSTSPPVPSAQVTHKSFTSQWPTLTFSYYAWVKKYDFAAWNCMWFAFFLGDLPHVSNPVHGKGFWDPVSICGVYVLMNCNQPFLRFSWHLEYVPKWAKWQPTIYSVCMAFQV